ncbi:MAG: AATGal transferase [Solirubrobacteraceae bacterium]|nr:AATGal transferase [Solirubrobacteraceae bacterium]
MLVLSSPLLAIFSLWVRQSSNGPVFQRQSAVTPAGERCFLYSFRVRIDGAGTAAHERMCELFGTGAERTVTTPGRVIRALRLERLPRLVNVVKGEASLF